jgi:hypothetical protein
MSGGAGAAGAGGRSALYGSELRPGPDEGAPRLDALCGGDAALRTSWGCKRPRECNDISYKDEYNG